jgi:hypothetical protein
MPDVSPEAVGALQDEQTGVHGLCHHNPLMRSPRCNQSMERGDAEAGRRLYWRACHLAESRTAPVWAMATRVPRDGGEVIITALDLS